MKSVCRVVLVLSLVVVLSGCRLFMPIPAAEEAVVKSIFDDDGHVLRAVSLHQDNQVLFEVCFKSKQSLALIEGSCLAAFLTHTGEVVSFSTERLNQVMSAQEREQLAELIKNSSLSLIAAADDQGVVQNIVAVTTLGATLTGVGHTLLTRQPTGILVGLLVVGLTATGIAVSESKAQSEDDKLQQPAPLNPGYFYNLPQLVEQWQAVTSTQQHHHYKVDFVKSFLHDLGLYLQASVPEGKSIDRYCYPRQPPPHPHNAQCYRLGYGGG